MPRMPTTADVFNAIAEPQRRRILGLLQEGEQPVAGIMERLQLSQPVASKHLRVLRAVDLVIVRPVAQQRIYRLNAIGLQPVHQWLGSFEQFWQGSFDRLDDYLARLQTKPQDPHAPRN